MIDRLYKELLYVATLTLLALTIEIRTDTH